MMDFNQNKEADKRRQSDAKNQKQEDCCICFPQDKLV